MMIFDGKINTLKEILSSHVVCISYQDCMPIYLFQDKSVLHDLFNRRCAFQYECLTEKEYNLAMTKDKP